MLPDQLNPGGFTPESRLIFGPYQAGGKYVYADPFRIRRLLSSALPGDTASRLLDEWENPASAERFLDAIRAVFGLEPFDPATGQGATEDAVIEIWNGWQAFCNQKKTTPGNLPTSSTVSRASPPLPPWATQKSSAS